MKKPIYKRRWFIVLTVFIFMGVAGSFVEDDTETTESSTTEVVKTTESTTKSSTTEVAKTTESTTNLYDLTTNLNNFPVFLEDFETKYNSEQEKSKAYNSMVKGKQATWTGTVVEAWTHSLVLIESSKYREGLTWRDILDEGLEYYTFIAKFDHANCVKGRRGCVRYEVLSAIVGEEKTITGEPGVRGMNTEKRKWCWKLYCE